MPRLERVTDDVAAISLRSTNRGHLIDIRFRDGADGHGGRQRVRLPSDSDADAKRQFAAWLAAEWPHIRDAYTERAATYAASTGANPTVEELADWFTDVHLPLLGRADKTIANNRRVLQNFADYAKSRRATRLSQIAWPLIEEWIQQKARTTGQRRDEILILRNMLTTAVEAGRIHSNPVKFFHVPRKPRATDSRFRSLTPTELCAVETAIRKHATPPVRRAVLWMIYTGFHVGDVLALNWQHVDWPDDAVRVTKGKGGFRLTFPLNDLTRPILNEAFERYDGPPRPSAPVFTTSRGERWTRSGKLLKAFQESLARADHPEHVTFRDLRKTFGDLCARGTFPFFEMDGPMPATSLRELMGHQNVATTLEHYTQTTLDDLRAATRYTGPGREQGNGRAPSPKNAAKSN